MNGVSSIYWKPDSATKLVEVSVRASEGSQMVEEIAKLFDVLPPPPQLTESDVTRKLSDDNCAFPNSGNASIMTILITKSFF